MESPLSIKTFTDPVCGMKVGPNPEREIKHMYKPSTFAVATSWTSPLFLKVVVVLTMVSLQWLLAVQTDLKKNFKSMIVEGTGHMHSNPHEERTEK